MSNRPVNSQYLYQHWKHKNVKLFWWQKNEAQIWRCLQEISKLNRDKLGLLRIKDFFCQKLWPNCICLFNFFFWNVDLGFENKTCDFAHFNSPQVLRWIIVCIESASTDLWCVLHDPIFNLLFIQIILQQHCYPPRV